ncbi:unnamed protein product [Ectocarpus sp. CCAP 1310/34]|nr:unnamed protein product [Ectocarpus sp. CCAP 1310/34]
MDAQLVHQTGHWVVQTDCSNAFNTGKRTAIMAQAAKSVPDLVGYIARCYDEIPAKAIYTMDSGERRTIECKSGVQQGDGMGPPLFCFILVPIVLKLRAKYDHLGLVVEDVAEDQEPSTSFGTEERSKAGSTPGAPPSGAAPAPAPASAPAPAPAPAPGSGSAGAAAAATPAATAATPTPAPASGAPVANDGKSGNMMFPGETEWGDGLGGVLFGTPAQNKGKRKKGRLELESPDFPIPDHGGGTQRKRYTLQFKVNAVRYSQRKLKGAQGPGGTVGVTYASRILKIPDKATLAAWVKDVDKYEAALAEETKYSRVKGRKKAKHRMSLNVGRTRTHTDAEREVVDWINDLRSDGISARVSTRMIKNKATELNPNFFGERPPPSDIEGNLRYTRTKTAWCRRFLRVYRFSVRAVTRQGQKLPTGWPVIAMQAIKEWRRLKYDVPSALELADGVECLGAVAGGSASGSGGGSGAGVPSGPSPKFALAQIANMDETPTWMENPGNNTVNRTGDKEVGVKTGGKEKMRITSVLTVFADGSKLPPLVIFKGQPTPKGKAPAANSIEREFKDYKDKKGYAYPRGVVYAVDPKAWHSQRVLNEVWLPQVWNQRPGRQGRLGSYRQPDTLLAWDDYTVHKTDASTKAMAESNTTLFLIPGGLTPKLQPCDGFVNKIFKANMSRLYDHHMASPHVKRGDHGYPEAPSRGLVEQWVKKSWEALTADEVRASWRKAGLLLPFDGSEDEAWANKELNSNAQEEPLDAPSAGADKADSSSGSGNLLEVLEIDDDDTGVVVVTSATTRARSREASAAMLVLRNGLGCPSHVPSHFSWRAVLFLRRVFSSTRRVQRSVVCGSG